MGPLLRSMRQRSGPRTSLCSRPSSSGGLLLSAGAEVRGLIALIAFCCASSAVYLINDLRDREEDRRHPLKRLRPLAAGTLSVTAAVAAVVVLVAAAVGLGLWLGDSFTGILVAYLLLNLLYTLWLKHMVILDVMILSLGFVLRVEAGGQAMNVEVSRWLFLCTTFLALFLAFSKRRHEITLLAGQASSQRPVL